MWNWHGCLKRARQTLFTPHHFYRIKNTVPEFLGPGKFSCRHAQFNHNQERPRDLVEIEEPSWNIHEKTASLYELRLKFGPLKCLHYLFYPNRAYFFSTRTIFTRARTTSPKVPARVRILVRHGWNLVLTGCLHCKFYPSRTFLFGTRANFTRAVPKNFCSVNRALVSVLLVLPADEVLRTFAQKFFNIDFFLKLLPL